MKVMFKKDVVILLFLNYISDLVFYTLLLGMTVVLIGIGYEQPNFVIWSLMFLIIVPNIAKYFVLPILYNQLEKHSNNENIQRFIKSLKTSNKTKLKVLLAGFVLSMIQMVLFAILVMGWNIFHALTLFFRLEAMGYIVMPIFFIFCGLSGNYLVLFLYWHIKDKKQKITL